MPASWKTRRSITGALALAMVVEKAVSMASRSGGVSGRRELLLFRVVDARAAGGWFKN